MSTATFYVGDVFDVLTALPDNSVDLVVTSPPFLGLRAYLPEDHPEKEKEIGAESTPGDFIDALLDVVEALDRVVAPHGSIVFELGDSYSGSGGAGGDYNEGGLREGQPKFEGTARASRNRPRDTRVGRTDTATAWTPRPEQGGGEGWPEAKSLCLIPESFRWALAYGRNPFTGRETPRWRVRNVIRWCRPNPTVGSLADKFRPATSDMVVACKSRTRYFDLDAVRQPHTSDRDRGPSPRGNPALRDVRGDTQDPTTMQRHPGGSPPLDFWVIPTQPYKGAHYAVFPDELVIKPVKAMCPERVCMTCGEPSRRIVDENLEASDSWSDCGHNDYRNGVVLDPFGGSGTTGVVATGHGRDAILIDIDDRNVELARERIGMFLTVVDGRSENH